MPGLQIALDAEPAIRLTCTRGLWLRIRRPGFRGVIMRCVGGVAAMVLAALSIACGGRAVAGNDSSGREAAHFLFFSGTDLWRDGAFLHGGGLWAPNGLDSDGYLIKLLGSGGDYHYRSGALGNARVTGREFTGQALAGWRFRRDAFTLTFFAGLDIESHSQSPHDPGASLTGTDAGAVGRVELWCAPSADLMLAADASASTIGPRYNARIAFGRRLLDRFFIGPEIERFQTDTYHQLRFGMHLTGLRTEQAEWSAAVGVAQDSDKRTGAYGRLGVNIRH